MSDRSMKVFGPGSDCPSIDDLLAGLDSESTEAQKHVASCTYCSTQIALQREFETASPNANERPAIAAIVTRLREKPPFVSESTPLHELRRDSEAWLGKVWISLSRPLVLAPSAIAVAALVAALWLPLNRTSTLKVPANDVMRSARVVALAPLGDIAHVPARFEWQPIAGALNYRIRLLEVDQTELWSATAGTNFIEVPAETQSRMSAGRKFLWQVEAMDSKGQTIATSSTQSFRIGR